MDIPSVILEEEPVDDYRPLYEKAGDITSGDAEAGTEPSHTAPEHPDFDLHEWHPEHLREVHALEQKVTRQREELAKLNSGRKRRRAYIKKLHAMFNRMGWCYQCDAQMTGLYDSQSVHEPFVFVGWHCYECGRTVYVEHTS